eukprot:1077006-Heterocapsa_arctica.AAC.1
MKLKPRTTACPYQKRLFVSGNGFCARGGTGAQGIPISALIRRLGSSHRLGYLKVTSSSWEAITRLRMIIM